MNHQTPGRRVPLAGVFAGFLSVLLLNGFVLGPAVFRWAGGGVGNLVYIGIRALALVGFGYIATRYYGRARWDTIRMGTLLAFLDHVIFRGMSLWQDPSSMPEGVTGGTAVMAILFAYIMVFPLILLLVFVGSELARAHQRRPQRRH